MTKFNLHIIIAMLSVLLGLTSCEDPGLWQNNQIPEGESTVKVQMGFKEFTPALDTRTAGDVLDAINRLYVLVYNTDGTLARAEEITDFDIVASKESTGAKRVSAAYTPSSHVEFKLTLPNGRYRIYAVVNRYVEPGEYKTEQALHNITVSWNSTDIGKNNQMFGWFVNGDNTTVRNDGFQAPIVEIKGNQTMLHAWLRRAASKITVAYDGSKLKDNVTVYLKSVTIKNLPKKCNLAGTNTPTERGQLLTDGETVTYATTEAYNSSHPALLSKAVPKYPYVGDPHAGNHVNSLFFYENMQGIGPDKRQKDEDGNGVPDYKEEFNGMPCGTYIEVEAYYVSTNPERPGQGNIKYRFMLGMDIKQDYNAERNYHYKLTLVLKNFANDPDWNIEYDEQHLEVSTPKPINYQGKYFIPKERLNDDLLNQGYEFSNENIITISSYVENKETGDKKPVEWEIAGYEVDGVPTTERPDWLTIEETTTEDTKEDYVTAWKYKIAPVVPQEFTINSKLESAPQKGTATQRYNLANNSTNYTSEAHAYNTANCYMVDAKGYYIIPLVYGNGRENGQNNTSAYISSQTGENILKNFTDHRGKPITSPFIKENTKTDCAPLKAQIIWQDESNLVTNVEYVSTAYGGQGGLKFDVPTGKQGNAVIAILDNYTKDGKQQSRVMWSWHIWVTRFDFDDVITLTNRTGQEYKVMPVNLGWCSKADEKVRYFKARECKVMFKAGEITKEIVFSQKSHTAFTCGTTPHYQWGRKDPFVGRATAWDNKVIYDYYGRSNGWEDPPRFTQDMSYDSDGNPIRNPDNSYFFDPKYDNLRLYTWRKMSDGTIESALDSMIMFPQTWHNPPHSSPGETIWGTTYKYKTLDNTYANLWGGTEADNINFTKTVYDPCPYGYTVGHYKIFSGFSGWGGDTSVVGAMYDVDMSNQPGEYTAESIYVKDVMEFYTNDDKTQSIVFPKPGYRDWDDRAACYNYGSKGFVWSRQVKSAVSGLTEPSKAYYLEFQCADVPHDAGKTGFVGITSNFYTANGYAIRPCKM